MALSLFDPIFPLLDEDFFYAPITRVKKSGRDRAGSAAKDALASLRLDFKETDDQYEVHADLPGFEKEAIHVDVDDRTLIITAERKREESKDTDKYHLTERHYGSVTRSLQLPESANMKSVSAKYENGVLTVSVAKNAEKARKKRRITLE